MKRPKLKIILMIVSIEFIGTSLLAQSQLFTYSKIDNNQQFRGDSVFITFGKYEKIGTGVIERSATFGSHHYKLTIKKNKFGKIEEFRSEDFKNTSCSESFVLKVDGNSQPLKGKNDSSPD